MSWKNVASQVMNKAKHAANEASKVAKAVRDKGTETERKIADKAESEANAATKQLGEMFDYIEAKAKGVSVAEEQVNAQLIDYARQVVKGNERAFKALDQAATKTTSLQVVKDELFAPLLKGKTDVAQTESVGLARRAWDKIIGDGGVPQDEWEWRDWLPHSLSLGLSAGVAAIGGLSGAVYFAFGSERYIPYYYLASEVTAGYEFEEFAVLQVGLWRATNGQAYGSFIGAEGAFYGEFGGGIGIYFDPRIIVKIIANLARVGPPDLLPEYQRAWQDFFQGGLAMGGVGAGLNVDVALGFARRSIPRIIYEAL